MSWYVYILKCADNTLYTGITTDIKRREAEHNGGLKGAKYTKARGPVKMMYWEEKNSRIEAARREYEIKQLDRKAKLNLI